MNGDSFGSLWPASLGRPSLDCPNADQRAHYEALAIQDSLDSRALHQRIVQGITLTVVDAGITLTVVEGPEGAWCVAADGLGLRRPSVAARDGVSCVLFAVRVLPL